MIPAFRSSFPVLRGLTVAAGMLVLTAPAAVHGFARTNANPPNVKTAASTCPSQALDIYWKDRDHKFVFFEDPAVSAIQGDLSYSDALAAITRGAQSWATAICTDLTFSYQGTTADFKIGYDRTSCTNTNTVIFRDKSCLDTTVVPAGTPCLATQTCGTLYNCWDHTGGVDGTIALTSITFDSSTGEIVDADMEFNAVADVNPGDFIHRYTVGDGPAVCAKPEAVSEAGCVATDLENTAVHEWGHFLGMDHTTVANSTMNPTAMVGETKKRILGQDDIDGICNIYPKGQPANSCVPPGNAPACQKATTTKPFWQCGGVGADGFSLIMAAGLLLGRRRRRSRSAQ